MVDREHLPIVVLLDVANRVEQVLRIGEIADPRVLVYILERIDLEAPAILAADQPAGLVRGIGARLRDQLLDLVLREFHRRMFLEINQESMPGTGNWTANCTTSPRTRSSTASSVM